MQTFKQDSAWCH